jgi:hypothetical protein
MSQSSDNEGIFPFENMSEAWEFFTKCARGHFAKVLKKKAQQDLEFASKIRGLRYKDYCSRLMYILHMCASPLDTPDFDAEFDMDWAMILAKPNSVAMAKKAVIQLIDLGLIHEIEPGGFNPQESGDSHPPKTERGKKAPKLPPEDGGDTGPRTQFDFDS